MSGPAVSRFVDFFQELRRRRVFRVAAAYAVVAWVVIEAASVIGPELMLPEWFTRAVILLAALGFPVALVLAWAYDVTPAGVRPAAVAEAERASQLRDESGTARAAHDSPSRPGMSPSTRIAMGLSVVAALLVAGWLLLGSRVERGGGDPAEILALADSGRYMEAFDLAGASGGQLPDTVWARISDRLTVVTEPEGARVLARRLGAPGTAPDTESHFLGTTPIHELQLSRGDYLLRIEREGFAPEERLASSAMQRNDRYLQVGQPFPGVAFRLRLQPAAEVPEDMVTVPGGRYTAVSPSLQSPSASLEDFFIDRFEVTNEAFARFVEAGGYLERRYWMEPGGGIAGGLQQDWVDRTGLPGPRGWSAQAPPPGSERHPVTGVTWHESQAFCRFLGRRLPTVYEWEKAARDGQLVRMGSFFMPWGPVGPGPGLADRANFSGRGTVPVDAHPFGISPYGAYAMAGNVKEWLANPALMGRAVTGGSWEDPAYMFSQVGPLDPATASSSVGFRCARLSRPHPDAGDQGTGPVGLATEAPVYQPVGEDAFAGLLSHYRYEPAPLESIVEERHDAGAWIRERIRFTGPDGDRILAYLYLPKSASPPFQSVLYMPASDVYFGVPVTESTEWITGPVIRSGRAVLTVVLDGMPERDHGPEYQLPEPHSVRFRDELVSDAIELRTGLDYLATRDDIDLDALAYIALSRGAASRLAFSAVDPRYRAAILIGAGIDERIKPTLPEVDNVNFAPRVATPILMVNGAVDEEHPWLTRGLPLWNLLPEPKELVLVEGAGHVPSAEERVPPILEFLDRTFGPVTRDR